MATTQPAPTRSVSLPDGPSLDLIFVEGGTFLRGDAHGDIGSNAQPTHLVRLDSFYLGKFPVTQQLWKAVASSKEGKKRGIDPMPFYHQGSDLLPAENISWDDITQKFLPALRALTNLDFHLPTEAQWEYAARGGRYSRDGYRYAGSDKLKELGWFAGNSDNKTHEVGQKYPNQLGLYDMSGNVWEWCADHYDSDFYQKCAKEAERTGKSVLNPFCEAGSRRVLRGGGYWDGPQSCAVAYRFISAPEDRYADGGFRLLLQFGATGA